MLNNKTHNNFLLPKTYSTFPSNEIEPLGWLKKQLEIQASGLSGHLDEFWPDIQESGWIGGKAEGWERGPYWLDGVVPLAYLLDDDKLISKVEYWMDYILTHQKEDGWLGPIQDKAYGEKYNEYDPWPVFIAMKALTQYYEVKKDKRVLKVMASFFNKLEKLMNDTPLFKWGKSRWADLVLSIHWLYEKTEEDWLLDLATKAQQQGYNWQKHFSNFNYKEKITAEQCSQATHVVNNAMAIKGPGIWFRQSHNKNDRDAVFQIIKTLDLYHGQVTGVFSGDEHYAGKSPSQGTELCAVVEYMFSLETLLSIIGSPSLADRLEKIAFNALPATFKPDMWAHQYDQQVNQVVCKVAENPVYTNNGPDSNIFGLEPHFGCCTANMHQGWPKFASHLWMKTSDGGIAAIAYAPSRVRTQIKGVNMIISLETDYPFHELLKFKVETERQVEFSLKLRIPSWVDQALLTIDNKEFNAVPESFYCVERIWKDQTNFTLNLPMSFKTERRFNNSISISRGPLVYSLPIEEDWRLIGGQPPHGNWEVYPSKPWNYAVKLNPDNLDEDLTLLAGKVGENPYSPDGAPISTTIKGRRILNWEFEKNAASAPPLSPVYSSEILEKLRLIPYGATNLRVTEFPLLS